jgi:hypothetical protein
MADVAQTNNNNNTDWIVGGKKRGRKAIKNDEAYS